MLFQERHVCVCVCGKKGGGVEIDFGLKGNRSLKFWQNLNCSAVFFLFFFVFFLSFYFLSLSDVQNINGGPETQS